MQEPWQFGEEVLSISRKYMNLRYELLPYIYDLMHECEQTGLPVMRPLVLEYPEDEQVRNRNDEFLLGDRMLVMEQGKVRQMDTPEHIRQNPADEFVRKLLKGALDADYK